MNAGARFELGERREKGDAPQESPQEVRGTVRTRFVLWPAFARAP